MFRELVQVHYQLGGLKITNLGYLFDDEGIII
jgi:hypothetical protein